MFYSSASVPLSLSKAARLPWDDVGEQALYEVCNPYPLWFGGTQ